MWVVIDVGCRGQTLFEEANGLWETRRCTGWWREERGEGIETHGSSLRLLWGWGGDFGVWVWVWV